MADGWEVEVFWLDSPHGCGLGLFFGFVCDYCCLFEKGGLNLCAKKEDVSDEAFDGWIDDGEGDVLEMELLTAQSDCLNRGMCDEEGRKFSKAGHGGVVFVACLASVLAPEVGIQTLSEPITSC